MAPQTGFNFSDLEDNDDSAGRTVAEYRPVAGIATRESFDIGFEPDDDQPDSDWPPENLPPARQAGSQHSVTPNNSAGTQDSSQPFDLSEIDDDSPEIFSAKREKSPEPESAPAGRHGRRENDFVPPNHRTVSPHAETVIDAPFPEAASPADNPAAAGRTVVPEPLFQEEEPVQSLQPQTLTFLEKLHALKGKFTESGVWMHLWRFLGRKPPQARQRHSADTDSDIPEPAPNPPGGKNDFPETDFSATDFSETTEEREPDALQPARTSPVEDNGDFWAESDDVPESEISDVLAAIAPARPAVSPDALPDIALDGDDSSADRDLWDETPVLSAADPADGLFDRPAEEAPDEEMLGEADIADNDGKWKTVAAGPAKSSDGWTKMSASIESSEKDWESVGDANSRKYDEHWTKITPKIALADDEWDIVSPELFDGGNNENNDIAPVDDLNAELDALNLPPPGGEEPLSDGDMSEPSAAPATKPRAPAVPAAGNADSWDDGNAELKELLGDNPPGGDSANAGWDTVDMDDIALESTVPSDDWTGDFADLGGDSLAGAHTAADTADDTTNTDTDNSLNAPPPFVGKLWEKCVRGVQFVKDQLRKVKARFFPGAGVTAEEEAAAAAWQDTDAENPSESPADENEIIGADNPPAADAPDVPEPPAANAEADAWTDAMPPNDILPEENSAPPAADAPASDMPSLLSADSALENLDGIFDLNNVEEETGTSSDTAENPPSRLAAVYDSAKNAIRALYEKLDEKIHFQKNWWLIVDGIAIIIMVMAFAGILAYYLYYS